MKIQHNIPAMNAYRNYTNNVSAVAKNLEKLSSGYRINRAGDDAAGLAISEKMRAQITGLETAQKNAKDGISLIQTAEGALTEVHSMLNRMFELAEQSANGTYDDKVDRANLQKEFDSLRAEIDRISKSSNFNGQTLLNGDLDGSDASFTLLSDPKYNDLSPIPTTEGNLQDDLGVTTKTILNKTGASESAGVFTVEFNDMTWEGTAGDDITVKVGDLELTVNSGTKTKMSAADIATAVLAKYGSGGSASDVASVKFKDKGNTDQVFTVEASGTTGLKFTQPKAPENSDEVVNLNMKVTVSSGGAGSSTEAKVTGSVNGLGSVNLGGTANQAAVYGAGGGTLDTTTDDGNGKIDAGSTITEAGIAALVESLGLTSELSAGANAVKVVFEATSSSNGGKDSLLLQVNGETVAVADATTKTAGPFSFTGLDSSSTALGNLVIVDGSSTAAVNTMFNSAVDIGLKVDYTAAVAGDPNTLADSGSSPIDTAAIKAIAEELGADSGNVVLTHNSSNDTIDMMIGSKVIATADVSAFTSTGELAFIGEDSSSTAVGSLTVTKGGSALNFASLTAQATGLTYAKAGGGGAAGEDGIKGTYNTATNAIVSSTVEGASQLASTSFTLTADMIKDGGLIELGGEKYIFKNGADSAVPASITGATVIDLTNVDQTKLLEEAGNMLTKSAENNKVWDVGHDATTGLIKLTEIDGQYNEAAKTGVKLDTIEAVQANVRTGTMTEGSAAGTGKPLGLQIGDTSESFNMLYVNVKATDCVTLGIDAGKINISGQGMSQTAMDAIKTAINTVSSTRGDLGAMQNRLEHTINNLGVMTENIQDAEASIRDTDIAKEMMAYTKNNILVQASQAMLAQANQLPQGVLQLLG